MLTHHGRSWRLLLGVCGLVGSLVALPAPATAAIVVTSLADPGTGGCTPAACTLRQATAAAPAGETITFASALFAQGPGTILLTSGELFLDKALTIQGPGPGRLRIDGNRASRVCHIGASAVVTLTGRTIRRGHCTGCPGAGILNEGTLTLSCSRLRDNRTGSVGRGLYNRSTATVISSTIRDNRRGGILNEGILRLTHSTVSSNTATFGGGFYNSFGTLTLTHSTVSSNTAHRTGGGFTSISFLGTEPTTLLRASIMAGNTAHDPATADCRTDRSLGYDPSLGHNLVGAGTGCPSDPPLGDLTVAPATVFTQVLGPLQAHGGPTFTHALLPGSPAIDAGDPAECHGKDQRGVPRPQGAGCDIGAFEVEEP